MKKKFLKPNNPILRTVSQEIPVDQLNSESTRKIVETMLNVVQPFMVGLAAPQIGISKRIILVDIKADGKGRVGNLRVSFPKENSLLVKLKVYINPEIIWKSKRKGEWYEGCFSTGRICGIVSRPTSIKIKALKLHSRSVYSNPLLEWKAKGVEEKHTGYAARIFQHEIDHLNGKLFVNHIKDPAKLHWVEEKEFPLYRDQEAWRNWPKKYPLPLA